MRYMALILITSVLFAVDPPAEKPLPAEIQKALDSRESAAVKTKAAYDAAIAKINTDAIKAMEKAVTNRTKAGDLEGAMAGKKLMDGWMAELAQMGESPAIEGRALARLALVLEGKKALVGRESTLTISPFPESDFTFTKTNSGPAIVATNAYLQFAVKPDVRWAVSGKNCRIVVRSSGDCSLQYDGETSAYIACNSKSSSREEAIFVTTFDVASTKWSGRQNANGDFRLVVQPGFELYSLEVFSSAP